MKIVKLTFSMLIDGRPHTAFAVPGTFIASQLVFTDPDGTVYRLEMDAPRLSITETGKNVLHLTLEKDVLTEGSVQTAGMVLPIAAKTTRLVFSESSLEATYELRNGDAVLSHHTLRLAWKPDESTRKEPTQTW